MRRETQCTGWQAGMNGNVASERERAPTVCIYATIAAAASPMDKRYGAVLGRGEGGGAPFLCTAHVRAHIHTHTRREESEMEKCVLGRCVECMCTPTERWRLLTRPAAAVALSLSLLCAALSCERTVSLMKVAELRSGSVHYVYIYIYVYMCLYHFLVDFFIFTLASVYRGIYTVIIKSKHKVRYIGTLYYTIVYYICRSFDLFIYIYYKYSSFFFAPSHKLSQHCSHIDRRHLRAKQRRL